MGSLAGVTGLYIGNTAVNKAYLGTLQVWPNEVPASELAQQNSGTWSGNSFTITLPTAPATTSTVAVFVAGDVTVTTPSGWTSREAQVNFMGHYLFTLSGTQDNSWVINCGTGVGTWWAGEITHAVYDTSASSNQSSQNISYTTPSLIPTAGSRHILASIASVNNTDARTVSGWTNSFAEVADISVTTADHPMQGIAMLEVAATGASSYATAATYSALSTGRSAIICAFASSNTDTTAPSVPSNLVANATSSSLIALSWTASTDDLAVDHYAIYRDGIHIGDAPSASYNDSGLQPDTTYSYTVSALDAAGNASAESMAATATTLDNASGIAHGDELRISDVGPWSLQSVAVGSESLQVVTLPGRGYWKMDTPNEWAPTGTYVQNNNPSNHGGVVPAGGMTIDGYFVPAGTIIAQFRDFSAGDFSAQGQGGSYIFRGCRFRNTSIGQASQFNDFTATYTNRLLFCDMGSTDATDAHWEGAFWKAIGGQNHVMYRNYCSYQYVTFQPNVPGCQFVENYVEKIIFYGGEAGPPGQLGDPLHMAVLGCEGGANGLRVLRNNVRIASPDESGHVFANGATFAFEGTNGNAYDDCQVKDNFLSGINYVILNFGEQVGSTNIVVTGNKVSTEWFTNGGLSGVEQVGPHPPLWGTAGNVKLNNTWANDYGSGGNGTGTPLGSRQYPTGNGPRKGTIAF